RRRHTRFSRDWSSDVCSSDLRRWTPILDKFDEAGVDLCYEIHPGEDLHDGVSYEMFLERVNNHTRANLLYDPSHFVLQQLDYLRSEERRVGKEGRHTCWTGRV